MTSTDTIEFLEHGFYVGRDSWPDGVGVHLDKEKGICILKKVENGRETITNYLWPIEDLKATDWTIVFFE